ncbi:DUF3575 domain-containing protein [Hymenobacter persicinus]|nr:DUF3575 domain-containing protein [Hymenobacter persicinus]
MSTTKAYGLLLGTLFCGAAGAQAQNNAVKIDIFQPIVNTAALSYEHKLSESSSFQLGLSFTINYREDSNFSNNSESPKTSGFGITPEYRLYLSEKHPALEGFYVAPYLRYQHLNKTGKSEEYNPVTNTFYRRDLDASLNAFGGGVVVGRHWIFKQRFSLDGYLGPSYMVSGISSNVDNINRGDFLGYYEGSNYGIRAGVSFGVAF